jgi:DNA polymerase-3 subunit delta
VLSSALRHAFGLLAARAQVEAGRSPAGAVEGWPRLHFSRKQTAERQLGLWSSDSLREAIGRLQAAILQTRRFPTLANASMARVLLEIAASARRSGRG